ncbi:hypothetical protein N6L26_09565 [Qipengyuania sp. SS22]|uniref:hypothetical protein n=1 Tax=Qipengyuania sp. SS22 TaxID=2979461 RepID=UPI0021E61571|nr:hypothetical protein [Qipengyuania sp. SS22]UYH54299.1 hypothetical protein N6L26_09565 [Qipengyuania sp. SS22]
MARMRSPNFPAMTLEDAVKAVESIYGKNRKAVIMREDAAKDIGYTGLTGRSMQVLGALVQYDLLENTSKGECRVTQIAEDILHGIPEEKKKEALHKAGHAPALFQAVFDRFEGAIPGENAVRSFLIQSGFTNDGAEKALKNFLATNRYLEMNGVAESYGSEVSAASASTPDSDTQEKETVEPSRNEQETGGRTAIGAAVFWNKDDLDFNLSSAGLAVTGATNSASELKAFIQKLEALAILLPDDEEIVD